MINSRRDVEYWESARKGFVTNYPNFQHWKRMDPSALGEKGPLNVYLHTPYCIQRCGYCYYKTVNLRGAEKQQRMRQYVDTLLDEIALATRIHRLDERRTHTIYMGGGTPTLLASEDLERIITALRTHLSLTDDVEITVEAEPVTLTQDKADTLRRLGVTRVSMGVQSFDDEVIKQSNRLDNAKKALKAIEIARTIGASVNIDLMSGLAGSSDESWQNTVDLALGTGVESITVYKTELYANTQYYQDLKKDLLDLPSDDEELSAMKHALERLLGAGYQPWSFFTFTQDGAHAHRHASSNFRGDDLYAFGISAFGHMGGHHFQNTSNEKMYQAAIAKGRLPIQRGHKMSALDEMIRYVLLCMKMTRLDLAEFTEKFGFRLETLCAHTIERLVDSGYLKVSEDALSLTMRGILHGDYCGKSMARQMMDHYR